MIVSIGRGTVRTSWAIRPAHATTKHWLMVSKYIIEYVKHETLSDEKGGSTFTTAKYKRLNTYPNNSNIRAPNH